MLSRKYYQMIASTIADAHDLPPIQPDVMLDNLAESLADQFKADNPRFDRDRFLSACKS